MDQPDEEKFHWIVIFSREGRVYPYTNRTVLHMTEVIKKFYAKNSCWPWRMWVIVDGEIQKVEIQ